MKNSWKKVVAMMIAAALCVSCGVTGFSEDIQTDENTEIVEVVEAQNQEEPPKEEAPVQEPAPAPEPAPVQEPESVKEPDPAPVQEPEPVKEPDPAPEAPKAEEPKAEPEPVKEPEAPKDEAPKQEEENKADEKTEENIEEKTEVPEQKIEESAEQKKEDIKADEAKKEEEIKAETQIEESKEESKEEAKAEESKEESKEEPKAEEKPAEQPAVPAATKVEQPVEDAPAADVVVKENITVCIEWEDEDDALGLRPQTRAVTLNGSDGQTYSATLSEKDGWQHTFADLTTQRGAEVIYYSVDADDVTDYDKDVRGLTVTYTCTAKPVVDNEPAADDENLIDDQMDGEQGELPEDGLPTITETEDGTVIDMGETAEAPVEGEDANAEKPEEDGELDEDFTLPEEGELPAEDAEPEIPEIDFSTLQVVIGEPQYDEDVMTLRATLIGFDNLDYALQWQFSTDDATWTDVPGATGDTLVVQLDESNAGCYWRVSAEVFGWKTLPTEQAAQE